MCEFNVAAGPMRRVALMPWLAGMGAPKVMVGSSMEIPAPTRPAMARVGGEVWMPGWAPDAGGCAGAGARTAGGAEGAGAVSLGTAVLGDRLVRVQQTLRPSSETW